MASNCPDAEQVHHRTASHPSPMITKTSAAAKISRIWSVNEWGKLTEVILGSPEGAWLPSLEDVSQRNFDRIPAVDLGKAVSHTMPWWVIEQTREDVADLAAILRQMEVVVHHANGLVSTDPVQTPDWQAEPENAINIRDITLIHGDLVIDAPSPTRGRTFETFAVRDLLSTAGDGRHWMVAPPRSRLRDHTYDLTRDRGINNTEPLFDAANCLRLGRDIVVDLNNTANRKGAEWLQQTLDRHHGPNAVSVHPVSISPDHIDAHRHRAFSACL